jgi:ribosome-associated protein
LARRQLKEYRSLDTIEIAHTIVNALEEKKGEDILLLDIREVAPLADYFVICSGTSDRMLDALVEAVLKEVKTEHRINPRVEGSPGDGWVLVDYGDVIVHIFSPNKRNFYRLEELWSQGQVILHFQ